MRLTVHPQQADGRGNGRLCVLRRGALQAREHGERLPVSHLPQRQRRIVLQRALEARDGDQRIDGVGCLVIAQRFDDAAPEEVLPAHHLAEHRLARARVGAERGNRADERGAHEFRRLLVERIEESAQHRRFGVPLEVRVGHFAQPIVRIVGDAAHHVGNARVIEGGEEDENTEADVAVGVAFEGLEERRGNLRGRTAAQTCGGAGSLRVIEIAEVFDRFGDGERDLSRWSRLRSRRLERRIEWEKRQQEQKGQDQEPHPARSPERGAGSRQNQDTTSSSSTRLSVSCR